MITFIIGLFIGASFGILFTSMLVLSRDESEKLCGRDVSARVASKVSLPRKALSRVS